MVNKNLKHIIKEQLNDKAENTLRKIYYKGMLNDILLSNTVTSYLEIVNYYPFIDIINDQDGDLSLLPELDLSDTFKNIHGFPLENFNEINNLYGVIQDKELTLKYANKFNKEFDDVVKKLKEKKYSLIDTKKDFEDKVLDYIKQQANGQDKTQPLSESIELSPQIESVLRKQFYKGLVKGFENLTDMVERGFYKSFIRQLKKEIKYGYHHYYPIDSVGFTELGYGDKLFVRYKKDNTAGIDNIPEVKYMYDLIGDGDMVVKYANKFMNEFMVEVNRLGGFKLYNHIRSQAGMDTIDQTQPLTENISPTIENMLRQQFYKGLLRGINKRGEGFYDYYYINNHYYPFQHIRENSDGTVVFIVFGRGGKNIDMVPEIKNLYTSIGDKELVVEYGNKFWKELVKEADDVSNFSYQVEGSVDKEEMMMDYIKQQASG